MNDEPAAEPFSLPRLSRDRKRARSTTATGWSDRLGQAALAALLALSIASPLMTDQNSTMLGDARQAGYVVILVAALLAIRPWRQPERLLAVPWPLLLAVGWCWLSLDWAIAPGIGLRRLALTTVVLWSAFALVRQVGPERTVAIMRWLLIALLAVNFATALFYPQIGIHGPEDATLAGDWRGVMDQKNFAGFTCAITILLCAFGAGTLTPPVRIGVAVASAVFLGLSDSATSVGICVAALGAGYGFNWLGQRQGGRALAPAWLAWLPLAGVAAVLAAMVAVPNVFFDALSDPQGFTGRTQIWTALIHVVLLNPLAGVGYGSVWDLGAQSPLTPFAPDWVQQLSQGHDGYLDLLAQVGAIGLLLVLFAVLVWPLQRMLRGGDDPMRAVSVAIVLFCLGHNFTESSLFDRDTLGQVFLMVGIALLWGATAAAVPSRRPADRHRRSSSSGEGRRRRRVRPVE